METILDDINESERDTEWYFKVQIIQGSFKEKYKGWWEGNQKYTSQKTCIICQKEPNCIERNWLTKVEFEKVKFGVMVYVARGKKEPSHS